MLRLYYENIRWTAYQPFLRTLERTVETRIRPEWLNWSRESDSKIKWNWSLDGLNRKENSSTESFSRSYQQKYWTEFLSRTFQQKLSSDMISKKGDWPNQAPTSTNEQRFMKLLQLCAIYLGIEFWFNFSSQSCQSRNRWCHSHKNAKTASSLCIVQ